MILLSSNPRSSITIFLSQYYNVISIIVQSATIQGQNQKKEWFFLDNQNQYVIFNNIVKELKHSEGCSFDPVLLDKWHQKSNHIVAKIILSSPYSSYNLPQSCFCISFINAKQINNFLKISREGFFEVLFFNCAFAVERSAFKEKDQLFEQLLGLLLFYLENHNLTYQVKNIEKLMKNRLFLYTKELCRMKANPNYNFNILYYFFFIKPLHLVPSTKLKIISASDFSKTVQGSVFSKNILQMGVDLEKKMTDLQNSIF